MFKQHAIVIGGSMAGLLTARVLADHFASVTLIERDHFSDSPEPRKGVPQGRHAHGLLSSGFEIMQQLFPGFGDELKAQGALLGDMAQDMHWFQFGSWKAVFYSGFSGVFASRPLLETTLRKRVAALLNVQIIDGCDVEGLVASADATRISGVTIKRKGGESEQLSADLVVEAGGRGSRSPAWLEQMGYGRPEESVIKIDVCYATRVYRRRPGDLDGFAGAVIAQQPPASRLGVALSAEGERWTVTLAGMLGDDPPTDEQGFLEFARSLPDPAIYNLMRNAEPISEIMIHRYPANLRRHYERMARFPEGYLVIGDAMGSFNPIYGQGMTSSAMQVRELAATLKEQASLEGLAQRFFARAAKVIDIPWALAAGADLAYPAVEGKRPAGANFINWYLGKVHTANAIDPEVFRAFLSVMNLLKSPGSLFHPAVVMRVIRANLFGQRNAVPAVRPSAAGD